MKTFLLNTTIQKFHGSLEQEKKTYDRKAKLSVTDCYSARMKMTQTVTERLASQNVFSSLLAWKPWNSFYSNSKQLWQQSGLIFIGRHLNVLLYASKSFDLSLSGDGQFLRIFLLQTALKALLKLASERPEDCLEEQGIKSWWMPQVGERERAQNATSFQHL